MRSFSYFTFLNFVAVTLLFLPRICFSENQKLKAQNISIDVKNLKEQNDALREYLINIQEKLNELKKRHDKKKALPFENPTKAKSNNFDPTQTSFDRKGTHSPQDLKKDERRPVKKAKQISHTQSQPFSGYYLSIFASLNFPSDTQLQGIYGTSNIESKPGIGFKTEIGKNFGYLNLGFSLGYESHKLHNMRSQSNPHGGEGKNSFYKFLVSPRVKFDLMDQISLSSGIDLGLVSRHSRYSASSVSFTDAGDKTAFVYALNLGFDLAIDEQHSFSTAYTFADYRGVSNFSKVSNHSIECGFTTNL